MSVFREGLFRDKVCLVTGGGTGIGKAIASELFSLGGTVVIAARRVEQLKATCEELTKAHPNSGGQMDHIQLDIRDPDAVDATIKRLMDKYGRIDCLVNNAGGQFASKAEDIRPKGFRAVIDTNLNGTWFVTSSAYKQNKAKGKTDFSIVTIVADYFNGFPGMAHTGAARAGVGNLTMTLAREWGPSGLRINAVAPGIILSSGIDTYPKMLQPAFVKSATSVPSGRGGSESEVASATVFLLTPAAAYINGAIIRVDGAGSLHKKNLMDVFGKQQPQPPQPYHLSQSFQESYDRRVALGAPKARL